LFASALGHGDALLLAARKLARAVVEPLGEPERGKQLPGPLRRLTAQLAGNQLGQDHVFLGGKVGQQVVELVDETKVVAAQRGAVA
jgi:hypothetical protein